jgi:transcriptional regulator with XRE-family HTH domain
MANTKIETAFGKRIKNRLKDLGGKTQGWMASEMKLSDQAITKWMQGKCDPKLSNLKQMAEVLKCSIGYLAGDIQDETIAEVVRKMEELSPDGRTTILVVVTGSISALPNEQKYFHRKLA